MKNVVAPHTVKAARAAIRKADVIYFDVFATDKDGVSVEVSRALALRLFDGVKDSAACRERVLCYSRTDGKRVVIIG